MDVDNANEQQIEDKYTSRIDATPDNADENDRRDAVTVGRENFLSIYNERQGGGDDDQNDEPDLTNGIKFRRDEEDD